MEQAIAMKLALPREAELEVASLVREHSRFLFRVAYSVLRNPHDAEDAVRNRFSSWRAKANCRICAMPERI